MTNVSHAQTSAALGRAARGAVLWGSGFTLLRDVVQFAMMLVLVRILSADDYGRAGLAQAVLGMMSVVSFKMLAPHALSARSRCRWSDGKSLSCGPRNRAGTCDRYTSRPWTLCTRDCSEISRLFTRCRCKRDLMRYLLCGRSKMNFQ